jgi:uncharacterized protein (TIGR02145 family)
MPKPVAMELAADSPIPGQHPAALNGIVGVGTASPESSAQLEINSSTKGFLPPRVTDTTAISAPVAGLMVYDTSSQCMRYYNGTNWSLCMGVPQWKCGDVLVDNRDGQSYSTVKIGYQCWMAENLNIGTRINGSANQSDNSTLEKYCYNDSTSYCDTYGGLYQWNEMMQYVTTQGSQGICPTGWHVPAYIEWVTLDEYLGSDAGGILKETGTAHWNSPNTGATNEYGFTALPGGYHVTNGAFNNIGEYGIWWKSKSISAGNASTSTMGYNFSNIGHDSHLKNDGLSVRCIQD